MLAGMESFPEVKFRIGERVVNRLPAKDRDIAMVFQSYALYPHMSVYDNMAFPLQMQHMKKAEIDRRQRGGGPAPGPSDVPPPGATASPRRPRPSDARGRPHSPPPHPVMLGQAPSQPPA